MEDNGYTIIEKNFYCRWGEIDIIAKKDDKIYFFEVKTRIGDRKGQPYEAVNYYKLKGLKRAIEFYLLKNKIKKVKLALTIISIILDDNMKVQKFKVYDGTIY